MQQLKLPQNRLSTFDMGQLQNVISNIHAYIHTSSAPPIQLQQTCSVCPIHHYTT